MQQRLDLSRLTLEALILRVRTAFAVAAVAAAILVWQAAAGQAATVAVTNHDLAFTAPGAEVNDLLVGRHSGVFEVRDLAATLVAGAGCNSVTGHEATCATTGIRSFTAALGQGGDQALVKSRLRLASVVVRGGSGADDLVSLVAAVQFLGGPGDDRLKGGTGDDALWGNRGDAWCAAVPAPTSSTVDWATISFAAARAGIEASVARETTWCMASGDTTSCAEGRARIGSPTSTASTASTAAPPRTT